MRRCYQLACVAALLCPLAVVSSTRACPITVASVAYPIQLQASNYCQPAPLVVPAEVTEAQAPPLVSVPLALAPLAYGYAACPSIGYASATPFFSSYGSITRVVRVRTFSNYGHANFARGAFAGSLTHARNHIGGRVRGRSFARAGFGSRLRGVARAIGGRRQAGVRAGRVGRGRRR